MLNERYIANQVRIGLADDGGLITPSWFGAVDELVSGIVKPMQWSLAAPGRGE